MAFYTPALLRSSVSYLPQRLCRPCLQRYLHSSRPSRASQPTIVSPSKPKKQRYNLVPPESFKPYTEADYEELAKTYTPEQIAAIKASEEAVDVNDLAQQATFRTNDPWLPNYLDDFSKHDLVLDKPLRAPEENHDPNQRFKTTEEIESDFAKWVTNLPPEPTEEDYTKFRDNFRLTVGKASAELNPTNYLAPAIPKHIPGLSEHATNPSANVLDPEMERLVKSTGLRPKEIKALRSKVMVTHRVVNQTKLGKIQSIYVMTIVGNQKGMLGVGEGKSAEYNEARTAAFGAAVRSMKPVPRYEGRTIFGDVRGKMGGCEVELFNRPPGELYPVCDD